MEVNAQYEIRRYAETIGNEIVLRWCPHAWEAFSDYVLRAVVFSADEMNYPAASSGVSQGTGIMDAASGGESDPSELSKARERRPLSSMINSGLLTARLKVLAAMLAGDAGCAVKTAEELGWM